MCVYKHDLAEIIIVSKSVVPKSSPQLTYVLLSVCYVSSRQNNPQGTEEGCLNKVIYMLPIAYSELPHSAPGDCVVHTKTCHNDTSSRSQRLFDDFQNYSTIGKLTMIIYICIRLQSALIGGGSQFSSDRVCLKWQLWARTSVLLRQIKSLCERPSFSRSCSPHWLVFEVCRV